MLLVLPRGQYNYSNKSFSGTCEYNGYACSFSLMLDRSWNLYENKETKIPYYAWTSSSKTNKQGYIISKSG